MKLQAKILFILSPLAIIPLLLVGWITYSEITTNNRHSSLEILELLTEETSKILKLRIEETESVASLLAESTSLNKFIQSTNIYEKYNHLMPRISDRFSYYLQFYPEIVTIRLRDISGDSILNLPQGSIFSTKINNSRSLSSDDKSSTSSFVYSGSQPFYVHTVKLFNGDHDERLNGSLFGYLDIVLSMPAIDTAIEKAFIEKYGTIFFVDKNGNRIRDTFDLDLSTELPLPNVKNLIKQEDGLVAQEIQFEGFKTYIQGHKVDPNLYMFSLLSDQQIISDSNSYFKRMAGIVCLSVFLFIVLSFLSIKYLLIKPLQKLGSAAQEIGRGNLGFQLDINNKDELGELSTSLKEMSLNLRQSNEQIRYFAYHDSLTRLPNRLMFGEYLGHALAHAKRRDQSLALMYLDLDDFKVINDTLGHQAGDAVLRELSTRLSDCLRGEDYLGHPEISRSETETVARLGGDEFIIFLPNISNPYEAATVANRVLKSISVPFHIENRHLHVSASIGITTYPKDGHDAETLIKNADMAMYHAKEKGKNVYSYYQESMNIAAFERLNLQNELRQALANNEFVLFYQPQVDLNNGEIVSVEALIRWRHPTKGLISPIRFIPIAEQSELIVPIGEWVLKEACKQVRIWRQAGHTDLCVSVNASASQLHRHDLKEVISETLISNDLPAEALEIELTETTISNSEEIVIETLTAIKSLGVRIAMDDFGTGYSSLSYLNKLPIDKIKVDRSFVQKITSNTTQAPIITAILAMAHSLDLPVTAEGVELQAQVDFLKDKGCGLIQGYLISHPVSADEISRLLMEKIPVKKIVNQPI
ncbi:MAG: EAL domain-containing protein [Gammaproteobacteria bacterium]